MPKLQDLTGLKFNKLTVIELDIATSTVKHKKWICKCDCGNLTSVFGTNLKQGTTTSCGCQSSRNNARKLIKVNTTHGLSRSKIYHIYHTMKNRCYKKSSKAYSDYGGRGIAICDKWLDSFEVFNNWAVSNGYEVGLTLERIDVNGNYEPSNCKWITQSEQSDNKRTTLYATINGETKTLKEWSAISGVKYNTLRARYVDYGWTGKKLLSKPHTRGD